MKGTRMKGSRRRHLVLAAAVVMLAGAACGSGDPASASLPAVSWRNGRTGGMDALLVGPLELTRGCLTVDDYVLSIPNDSVWDEPSQTLTVRFHTGTESFTVGGLVEVGGGIGRLGEDQNAPEACLTLILEGWELWILNPW